MVCPEPRLDRRHGSVLGSPAAALVQRGQADPAGVLVDHQLLRRHNCHEDRWALHPDREALPRGQDGRPGPRAFALAHGLRSSRLGLRHK